MRNGWPGYRADARRLPAQRAPPGECSGKQKLAARDQKTEWTPTAIRGRLHNVERIVDRRARANPPAGGPTNTKILLHPPSPAQHPHPIVLIKSL
jgi:hypothetical protein